MTLELVFVLSVVSVSVSILLGLSTLRRATRNDSQNDTSQMTTVIIKLENISNGISEIKGELNVMRLEVKELRDRLIIAEQKIASAWRRIEIIECEEPG